MKKGDYQLSPLFQVGQMYENLSENKTIIIHLLIQKSTVVACHNVSFPPHLQKMCRFILNASFFSNLPPWRNKPPKTRPCTLQKY